MATWRTGKSRGRRRGPRAVFQRRIAVEHLEDRRLLAVVFQDINPDQSDLDAGGDPDGASMGRVNGLAAVGRQDLGTANNDIFYAATEWGGLYKTTDAGRNWTFLDKHLPLAVWDVEVNPASTNVVYATSFYDGRVNSVSGIEISLNAGADWFQPVTAAYDPALENTVNDNTPQAGFTCANPTDEPAAFGISVQPDNTQNVFIGSSCGLARSTDGGMTWQFLDPTATVAGVAANPANNIWDVVAQAGGIIDVVGTVGHRRSTDGGNTWSANNIPFAASAAPSQMSIAASPDENYVLFVTGNDNQIYESDDGGLNWAALGTADPSRGGGRLPFVTTNQRSDAGATDRFDVWTGGVSLYRVACTTPPVPAPSNITLGNGRCPAGAVAPPNPPGPVPLNWFGGWTRNGLGNATGAHDDVGDVVFDTEATNDAIPLLMSSDGGVYYATTNNANPQVLGDLAWEQPDVGPHAMWVYAMDGVDQPGEDDEDLYLGLQDNGSWATRKAVPTTADWTNVDCCDVFDIVADQNRVLYSFTGPLRMYLRNPGLSGGGQITTAFTSNLPGTIPTFQFPDFIDRVANNQYAAATTGAGGGVFLTNDVTVNPVVWNQLGAGTTPAGGFCQVQVSTSGGTPTFYAMTTCIGVGEQQAPGQLWRFVGTGAGNWQRIDNNDGLTGGFGIFAVDPNNPNRLYASNFGGPTGLQMVVSTDGGINWDVDANLGNLMTGAGSFKLLTQAGPTSFAHTFGFQGYAQPSLLAYDPENGNNLVAGGRDSGVFLSTDGGASWRLLTDPTDSGNSGIPHLPRPFFAYFDHEPADTTTVYIGTQGRGVWRIFIDGDGFELPMDRFEPNDTIGTATVLGSLAKITERELTIHDAGDVDYFQYTAQDTGKLVVNTFFDLNGDIDLRVRDVAGNIIAAGTQTNVGGGRVREQLVIPVVTQQQYFIELFSGAQHTNDYDLEIENFPVPIPIAIDLDAADDSGMSDTDNVTNQLLGTVTVLADLSDFAAMGISVLGPGEVAVNDSGAAVEVFVGGQSQGFAQPVGGSDSTLFQFTFGAGDLAEGLNFVTAAVRIFDGKTPQASGRSQLSPPLLLTLDVTAPVAPLAPDLLPSSDSGMFNNDDVTNKMRPAFSGVTERNASVRVMADGVVVGEATATSGGAWEITVEPLDDDVYDMTVVVEDLAGNVSSVSAALQVEIDTLAPNTPHLDLAESSDSGRHNDDNITLHNTPEFSATTQDPNSASHLLAANLRYRIFDRLENSAETLVFDTAVLTSDLRVMTTLAVMADGIHNLKLEVEDRAGNISPDFLLDVLIDTIAPSGTVHLFPDSDTSIWGFPETMTDLVTADKTPLLYGATEANALVRAAIDDVPAGTAVAVPYDGDDAFPPPPEFDGNYFLQTILNLDDGEHTIGVFFQDVAGNESVADEDATLTLFIDTQGPRITNVTRGLVSTDNDFSFDGATSVFEPKPSSTGPDPLVHSIVVHFSDLPDRSGGFSEVDALYLALAEEEGNYRLEGDHSGFIAIVDVNVSFTTIPGDGLPETAAVELVLDQPLPDDRFTLWVADSIADPAGNRLDGESGAQGPFDGNNVPDETPPIFPTGDGQHGGAFFGRFTIDSRPEIGTAALGTSYIDINGNFVFDPEGKDRDYTNRDIVFQFGLRSDSVFAGNFAPTGAALASGYDKLGSYGVRDGQGGKAWRWRLDFDHDGVIDSEVVSGVQTSGSPVAGNFAAGHPGDEIGLFNGGKWYLDAVGDNNIGGTGDTTLQGNMRGQPIVGDFDGDGLDDLATWNAGNQALQTQGKFQIDLAANGLTGDFDREIEFDLSGVFEQPVAADMNGDGIDDLGLFVTRRQGVSPEESAEWFFLISDVDEAQVGEVTALDHPFTPVPFGHDRFAQFGDELAAPIVGNFDPPTSLPDNPPPPSEPVLDVNRDGYNSPIDALIVINALNAAEGRGGDESPAPLMSSANGQVWHLDVSGDRVVSPFDALLIINHLNGEGSVGEGESGSGSVRASDRNPLSPIAIESVPVLFSPEHAARPSRGGASHTDAGVSPRDGVHDSGGPSILNALAATGAPEWGRQVADVLENDANLIDFESLRLQDEDLELIASTQMLLVVTEI